MRKIILSVSILLSCTSLLKAQESSATKVFEYRPAPGQFINLLPAYANGDNEQTICNKCLEAFKTTQLVSLGGFGDTSLWDSTTASSMCPVSMTSK